MGTTAPCFQRGKETKRCDNLRWNIKLETGIRISEHPFVVKAVFPSIPTDFDGRSRLIALCVSESQTEAVVRESDDGKSAESPRMRVQWLLKTLFRVGSKSFYNFTWQVQTVSINHKFRSIYFYDKFS